MVSSPAQLSLSMKLDDEESPDTPHHKNSIQSLSESDLIIKYSFKNKVKSGMKWLIHPFQKCCSSEARLHQTSKHPFDSHCLKPQFNQVNGLLKYFAFGVMFSNGM
jgi:hypothetical protein